MDLNRAITDLDRAFGSGYAEDNPQVVVEYIKAHALSTLKYQIEGGNDELRKSIDVLSGELTKLAEKVTQNRWAPKVDTMD
ncbi:MAG: hypothetical protein Q8M66_08755 [Actinomycetota bacterium]|nr:hypothetical protein [Actinomycetota bacterium]